MRKHYSYRQNRRNLLKDYRTEELVIEGRLSTTSHRYISHKIKYPNGMDTIFTELLDILPKNVKDIPERL